MTPSSLVRPVEKVRLRSQCMTEFKDAESFVMAELGFKTGLSSIVEGPCFVVAVIDADRFCAGGMFGDDLFVISGVSTGWISESCVVAI
jgi:hypothetical protein